MSTSSASSHDMYPLTPVAPIRKKAHAASMASEAELIKAIQANVGGPAGLSVLENPADVRKAVIYALSRIQESATDAERIKLGDLNPKERRIVRTVTNRGAAVRSRLRQRKELERLRQQLKEKDTRVKMLEQALTQAIAGGSKYIPPAVHQLLPNLVLPTTATAGNALVKQEQHQYSSIYAPSAVSDVACYQENKPLNVNKNFNSNNSIYNSPITPQRQYNHNHHNQVPCDQLPLAYPVAHSSPISTISAVSLKQEDEITNVTTDNTASSISAVEEKNIQALEQLISHNTTQQQNQYQYSYNNIFV